MTVIDKIYEGLQGLSFGGVYLYIKTSSDPEIWYEFVHGMFAISTAIIIAVLSTLVIHYVKKFLIPWFDNKILNWFK